MNYNIQSWVATFGMLLIPLASQAQTVSMDMELRPRTEVRDGYKTLSTVGKDAGIFTQQRSRLSLAYTSGVLNAQMTLQDSRTFGQYANASSDATTGLYEAWAEMVLVPGGTFKVGRQTLKYDDNRLFSAPTWSNTGTTHDLALFKYQLNGLQMHLGYAYNNSSDISSESLYANTMKYRSMLMFWASKELVYGLTASVIAVDEGVQDTVGVGTSYKKIDLNQALTYGGNLMFSTKDKKLSLNVAAYTQAGKSSKGKNMSGSLATIKGGYTFTNALAANIGADWFSGDSKTSDSKQTNFKKLYGSDHTYNGYMDYWNTPLDQGLLDYYGSITTKLSSSYSMEGAYHLFSTDKALTNGKKDLGSELDLVFNAKLNPLTSLQAGWCCYLTSDNTALAKKIAPTVDTKFPQWAYVMLTIKPNLYKTPAL